jgi:beta-glucosidase
MSPAESALMARRSDAVVVFGIKMDSEGFDDPDLSLPWGQDAVIDAVAEANPNTIVVLETGNPVAMPWRDKVKAIVEAWYPGQAGGQAIAEVLTGAVNPSGRLPITFPADLVQTPRPELSGMGTPWGTPVTVEYNEGAEVGYRWFAKTGATPLYAFGHGLSYNDLRLPRPRDPGRRDDRGDVSPSPTRATVPAPTCRSSTSSRRPVTPACASSASSESSWNRASRTG